MDLIKLFWVFFKVGSFAIGGAYSFLPLLEREIVENYHWLTKEEFLDVTGMVQVIPGAISIKYATYVGYKVAGIPGAIVANIGNLIVPVILVFVVSRLYMKYKSLPALQGSFSMIKLAVFSMIIAVALQLVDFKQLMQWRSLLMTTVFLFLFAFAKIHPALIIIGAGICGAIMH